MFGYWGRLLRVNLTTGQVRKQPYGKQFAREYLGDSGFAARLIADNVPADVGPLDDASAIVFAVGPLTGLPVPGADCCHVATISPETGQFEQSNFAGDFAAAQKRTGFDAIVITGHAARPVYLHIGERRATLEDATDFWDKSPEEANPLLEEDEPSGAVAISIGPAGAGTLLPCGVAAVMANKKLKGIVAIGRKKTQLARADQVKALLADSQTEETDPEQVELLGHVTGWDIDKPELEQIAERIHNLERQINTQRGA